MSKELSEATLSTALDIAEAELEATDASTQPVYYTVAGSHLYETANSESDIDVRGFHCTSGVQYTLLQEPEAQLSTKNSPPVSERDIDFVSYELKYFGKKIAKCDFNTVEILYSQYEIKNNIPTLISTLRSIMRKYDFLELNTRYLGMAQSLRNRYQRSGESRGKVKIKSCLYALRGALAAEYVNQNDTVEPRLSSLIETLLTGNNEEAAKELAEMNSKEKYIDYNSEIVNVIDQLIEVRLDLISQPQISSRTREAYRTDVQDWMIDVRDRTDMR